MRNCFAACLEKYVKEQDEIVLLYADIGNRLFNKLKDLAGPRVINAGIAEANMAGMAAGMAMNGMKPFIYTITPFTTSRNFEQIKVDIAYQNLPVVIAGTGSGLGYANLGPTHHSFEDLALMRVLPNMQVVCPADVLELEALFPQILKSREPVYLRLGKKNEAVVHPEPPNLSIGKAHVLIPGERICLMSCGSMLETAKQVSVELGKQGLKVEVCSFHTVKPLDDAYLDEAYSRFDTWVTLEEHSVIGGFGSAISDWLSERLLNKDVLRFGIPDLFIDQVSGQQDAKKKAGLSVGSIVEGILAYEG